MRVFKKLSLIFMSFLLAFTFLVGYLPFSKKSSKNRASAAEPVQLISDNVLQFVQLSIDGKPLSKDCIKSVDTNNDGIADTSYIIAKSVTLNFEPLKYNYTATFNSSLYIQNPNQFESNVLEKNPTTNVFPNTFTVNGTEYNYQISTEGVISITEKNSSVAIGQSDFITLVEDENTRKFVFTTSYTLSSELMKENGLATTSFVFSAASSNTAPTTSYSLNFIRPVVDFATEHITSFTCQGLDIGETAYTSPIIQRELSYENVKLEFTNNDYTEFNPLYFNINHNGFIYTFKLYSKTIDTLDYLFVEYYDEQRKNSDPSKNNNESLATKLKAEDNSVIKPVYKYLNESHDFNKFSINFDTTGRYEIEVYDETYLLLKNQRKTVETEVITPEGKKETQTTIIEPEDNKHNYNYLSTSFYIKTKELSESSSSAYDNAYAIMQSYDDDGNYLDYIVSESTQNNSVEITIKNLNYYFENDEFIKNFEPTEALPDLNIVEFKKANLPGSANLIETTYYTLSQLKDMFNKQTSKEKTLKIDCSDDAVYEVVIYQYKFNSSTHSLEQVCDDNHKSIFTIVKQPRTTYTVTNVDEFNDPTTIDGKKTTNYYADTPYTTKSQTYKINIDSSINLNYRFERNEGSDFDSIELHKTYLNQYTITYAMQAVEIEQVKIDENSENKGKLGLAFYGVGDIKVSVTVNSLTTNYTVKSGQVLFFDTYGTYSVAIEDSMGTVGTKIFSHNKPTSVSAIILIVLVGVIVLAVVLFIISSRGKVKTR